MTVEIWILIVLAASAGSAWLGFFMARRGVPRQAELDALSAELDGARQEAESVQSNVSEHFEQSAMLFGKLAEDYREFLEHFSTSAQALGVSESRARELLEQGYQPLITHDQVEDADAVEAAVALEDADRVEDAGPVEDAAEVEKDARIKDTGEQATDADQNEAIATTDATDATGVADVVVEMPEDATSDDVSPRQASS